MTNDMGTRAVPKVTIILESKQTVYNNQYEFYKKIKNKNQKDRQQNVTRIVDLLTAEAEHQNITTNFSNSILITIIINNIYNYAL